MNSRGFLWPSNYYYLYPHRFTVHLRSFCDLLSSLFLFLFCDSVLFRLEISWKISDLLSLFFFKSENERSGGSDLERSATSEKIFSVATLLLWSLKNCFFYSSSSIRTALPRLRSRYCSSENLIVDAIILCLSTYSFPHFVRKLQILRIFSSSSFLPPLLFINSIHSYLWI